MLRTFTAYNISTNSSGGIATSEKLKPHAFRLRRQASPRVTLFSFRRSSLQCQVSKVDTVPSRVISTGTRRPRPLKKGSAVERYQTQPSKSNEKVVTVIPTGRPTARNCDVLESELRKQLQETNLVGAWRLMDRYAEQDLYPTQATYKKLVQEFCLKGRTDLARQTYNKLSNQGLMLNGSLHRLLIVSTAREQNQAPLAMQLYQEYSEEYKRVPTVALLTTLVTSLARHYRKTSRQKYADWAVSLWWELCALGKPLDLPSCNAGMMAAGAAGDIKLAHEIAQAMLAPIGNSDHTSPGSKLCNSRSIRGTRLADDVCISCNAFNHLIMACGAAREGAAAEAVLTLMEEAGVTPDASTLGALVAALVRSSGTSRAVEVLHKTRALGPDIPPPDAYAYTTLMKGFALEGRLDRAVEIMQEMQAEGVRPTAVTYGVLIDGALKEGKLDSACKMIEQMEQNGCAPNAVIYNTLLREHSRRLELDRAFQVLKAMQARQIQPSVVTYNTLMDACVRARDSTGALHLFRKMVETGLSPDAYSYTSILRAFYIRRSVTGLMQTFKRMQQDPNVLVDTVSYNIVLEALVRAKKVKTMEEVLKEMRQSGVSRDVVTYSIVLTCYSRVGRVQSALDAFECAIAEGIEPDEKMYRPLVLVVVRYGSLEKALKLVQDMEQRGLPVHPARLKQIYLQRSEGYQDKGNGSGAGGLGDSWKERKSGSPDFERFKFWLGLPNNYYNSDP